jgi:iron complex outermembrane receptor protein
MVGWIRKRQPGRLYPALLLCSALCSHAQEPGDISVLKKLSLEELMDLRVTTVSRRDERWWQASSAVAVVTGHDMRRAGVTNLPDALRLAPGVHVGQSSARSWAISLRGMNVLAANKQNVLLDGRGLFTPFFSGVQWDAQDTLLEDIERVEVVSGPVAAVWGSFAVNGFIQILTKPAWDTQGALVTVSTGNEDPLAIGLRYGGRAGRKGYYRVYAKYAQMDWTASAAGHQTQPGTDIAQTGFRFDQRKDPRTTVTLQGDYYTNQDLPLDRLQVAIDGFNLLGRWKRDLGDDGVEFQAYFDQTYRLIPFVWEERRSSGSFAGKYNRTTDRNELLVGVDAFVSADTIGNIGLPQMEPRSRRIHRLSGYVHDVFQLIPSRLNLTLGGQLEHNAFSGVEFQPTARLAWFPNGNVTLWGGVARAVRAPVRIDQDLIFRRGNSVLFEATDDFASEAAMIYELGLRARVFTPLTVAVSSFAYRYDNLRSTELRAAQGLPPTFQNRLNATSYGTEITAWYQPLSWLHVNASYRFLDLDFWRDSGSTDVSRGAAEGNDPRHLLIGGVHLALPANLELDAYFRHASALPNPRLDGYNNVDARLGWSPSPRWEFALIGRNLLHAHRAEFITTNSLNEQVPRRFLAKVTWRY